MLSTKILRSNYHNSNNDFKSPTMYKRLKAYTIAGLNTEEMQENLVILELFIIYIIFLIQINVCIGFMFYMLCGGGAINVYALYTTLSAPELNHMERACITTLHGEQASNFRSITMKKKFGPEFGNVIGLIEKLFNFIFKNFNGFRVKDEDTFAEMMLGEVGLCGEYCGRFNTLPLQTNFKTDFGNYIFNNLDSLKIPQLFNFNEFMLGDEYILINRFLIFEKYSGPTKFKFHQFRYFLEYKNIFITRIDIICENIFSGSKIYSNYLERICEKTMPDYVPTGNFRRISTKKLFFPINPELDALNRFLSNFDSLNTPQIFNFCEFMLGDEQTIIIKPISPNDYKGPTQIKLRKVGDHPRFDLNILHAHVMCGCKKYVNCIENMFGVYEFRCTEFCKFSPHIKFRTKFGDFIIRNFDSLNTPQLFNFCEFMIGDEQSIIVKPTFYDLYRGPSKLKVGKVGNYYIYHVGELRRNRGQGHKIYLTSGERMSIEMVLSSSITSGRYYTQFNILIPQFNFNTNFGNFIIRSFDSINTPQLFNFCEFMVGDEQSFINLEKHSGPKKIQVHRFKATIHYLDTFQFKLSSIYDSTKTGLKNLYKSAIKIITSPIDRRIARSQAELDAITKPKAFYQG